MDFYLARHGETVADLIDAGRPLTRAGKEDVERVARLALAKAVQVSAIYHSGVLRAQQTAEIFARHLAADAGVRVMAGLKPDDDPYVAAAELEQADAPLLLVGHLPHLSRLASVLSRNDAERDSIHFTPATLVCYARSGSLWRLNWTLMP
jgi:phosphohistidine phosphatase